MPLDPPFPLEVGEAVDVNDRGEVIGLYSNGSPERGHRLPLAVRDPAERLYDVTVLPPIDDPEAI